jgi:hypothetical protein
VRAHGAPGPKRAPPCRALHESRDSARQRAPIDGLIGALFQACGNLNTAYPSSPTAIVCCPLFVAPTRAAMDAARKIQSTFDLVTSNQSLAEECSPV